MMPKRILLLCLIVALCTTTSSPASAASSPSKSSNNGQAIPFEEGELDVPTDLSATDLAKRIPSRWKSYLPESLQSGEATPWVAGRGQRVTTIRPAATTIGARKATKESSSTPSARRHSSSPPPSYQEATDSILDDDDDDEDDEDDEDEYQEAMYRAHLKSRARAQRRKASQALKRATRALNPDKKNTSASDAQDGDAGHRSLGEGIKALFSFGFSTAKAVGYTIALMSRYAAHLALIALRATRYIFHQIFKAFLFSWSSLRWATRETLRPVSVISAPLIYLFLGIKWTFWDFPTYYLFYVLREVYPLYVFCGAALALGTAIGLASAVVLYVGSMVFSTKSPLETHFSQWGEKEAGRVRAIASPIEEPLSSSVRRGRKKGSSKRRRNEQSVLEKSMNNEQARYAASLSAQQKSQSESEGEDGDGEETVPDYLRGLGTQWRPLPKAHPATMTPGLPSTGGGGERRRSHPVEEGPIRSQGQRRPRSLTTSPAVQDPGLAAMDYFSVSPRLPPTSSAQSIGSGSRGGSGLLDSHSSSSGSDPSSPGTISGDARQPWTTGHYQQPSTLPRRAKDPSRSTSASASSHGLSSGYGSSTRVVSAPVISSPIGTTGRRSSRHGGGGGGSRSLESVTSPPLVTF